MTTANEMREAAIEFNCPKIAMLTYEQLKDLAVLHDTTGPELGVDVFSSAMTFLELILKQNVDPQIAVDTIKQYLSTEADDAFRKQVEAQANLGKNNRGIGRIQWG